jgi:hypothetical protein
LYIELYTLVWAARPGFRCIWPEGLRTALEQPIEGLDNEHQAPEQQTVYNSFTDAKDARKSQFEFRKKSALNGLGVMEDAFLSS